MIIFIKPPGADAGIYRYRKPGGFIFNHGVLKKTYSLTCLLEDEAFFLSNHGKLLIEATKGLYK